MIVCGWYRQGSSRSKFYQGFLGDRNDSISGLILRSVIILIRIVVTTIIIIVIIIDVVVVVVVVAVVIIVITR